MLGNTMEQTQKMGRFRKGWELTKSSWHILRLDKELAALPLIGLALSIPIFAVFFMALFGTTLLMDPAVEPTQEQQYFTAAEWAMVAGFLYLTTLISNFIGGAVIYGALTRFSGGDPTIRGCLAAAWHKLRPLAMFSLLMATVGLILQIIAERLPFGGRIAVWLVGAAWNVANVFALPIIMTDKKPTRPLDATRGSVRMIRQVWGEGAAAAFGLAIIGALVILGWMVGVSLLSAAVGAIAGQVFGASSGIFIILSTIAIMVLGTFALTLAFSVMENILKAALYHYATTGQAPATFNRELLHAAMTPKKARRIFA